MLSKSCIYALRSVIYIAAVNQESFISIREITKKLNLSFYFLTKILQILTKKGILESVKGPKGGIRLAKPASNITLMEIVLAIDGTKLFDQCILGLPGCGVLNPCPLHDEWFQSLNILKDTFNKTTLADLAQKVKENNLRITDVNDPLLFKDQ